MDLNALIAHMKSYKISKREISLVESAYKNWSKQNFIDINLNEFLKKLIEISKYEERHKIYSALKPQIDKINQLHEPALKSLFQFLISLGTDNKAWSKKVARKLLIYHPSQFKFALNQVKFDKVDYSKFLIDLANYLKDQLDKIDEPLLKKMIANQIDLIFYVPFGKKLDIDTSFSLSDIRKSIQSVIFGKPFFDYWFVRFDGRTSVEESISVLSKNLTAKTLSEIADVRLWVLLYYINGEDAWRKVMIDRVEKIGRDKNLFLRELLLSLLAEPIVKQELATKSSDYTLPLFRMQRDYYRSCVDDRFNSQYCFFKLISIGDLDRDLIWFYVLKKVGVFNE